MSFSALTVMGNVLIALYSSVSGQFGAEASVLAKWIVHCVVFWVALYFWVLIVLRYFYIIRYIYTLFIWNVFKTGHLLEANTTRHVCFVFILTRARGLLAPRDWTTWCPAHFPLTPLFLHLCMQLPADSDAATWIPVEVIWSLVCPRLRTPVSLLKTLSLTVWPWRTTPTAVTVPCSPAASRTSSPPPTAQCWWDPPCPLWLQSYFNSVPKFSSEILPPSFCPGTDRFPF